MPDLASAIRDRIDSSVPEDMADAAVVALLAVVDKCEQLRAESAKAPGGVGHFFADEFEGVIARALGVRS